MSKLEKQGWGRYWGTEQEQHHQSCFWRRESRITIAIGNTSPTGQILVQKVAQVPLDGICCPGGSQLSSLCAPSSVSLSFLPCAPLFDLVSVYALHFSVRFIWSWSLVLVPFTGRVYKLPIVLLVVCLYVYKIYFFFLSETLLPEVGIIEQQQSCLNTA